MAKANQLYKQKIKNNNWMKTEYSLKWQAMIQSTSELPRTAVQGATVFVQEDSMIFSYVDGRWRQLADLHGPRST